MGLHCRVRFVAERYQERARRTLHSRAMTAREGRRLRSRPKEPPKACRWTLQRSGFLLSPSCVGGKYLENIKVPFRLYSRNNYLELFGVIGGQTKYFSKMCLIFTFGGSEI